MLHKNYNSNKKFLVNKHNNIRARKIDKIALNIKSQ